jgi:hypothetical protein
MSDGPSSLDHPEFPVDGGSDPLPEPFRHRGWRRDRLRIYAALATAGLPESRRRAFARCGSHTWVLYNEHVPDLYRVVRGTCHDRFCRPCAAERAARIRDNLRKNWNGRPFRFVTLTLAHTDDLLSTRVNHLLASFRRMRQRGWWRGHVVGGIAFLEIGLGRTDGLWHPHLHVICQGRYMPQHQLATLWEESTGDSRVVDVRLVTDFAAAASYITKYVSKAVPRRVIDNPDLLADAAAALTNQRTLIAFGTWRKYRLLSTPAPGDWHLYAHESELRQRMDDGDTHAAALLDHVYAFLFEAGDAEFTVLRPPRPPPPPPPPPLLWQ